VLILLFRRSFSVSSISRIDGLLTRPSRGSRGPAILYHRNLLSAFALYPFLLAGAFRVTGTFIFIATVRE
jgi:hypothetical protein